MQKFIGVFLLSAISLFACGSESNSSMSTVDRGSDDSVAVEPSEQESIPENSSPASSTDATVAPPETFDLPVADLPPCVFPTTLAVDASGRAYQVSEPMCAGGWMFVYSTECEYECESSLGIQMVDGQWQLRGWIYNVCYEGAVGSYGLPTAVAVWHIRWSCEADTEGDVYQPVAEPRDGPLSLGDFGPRVIELDQALSTSGFLVGTPNDAFDFDTLKAVLDLQFQMGLEVDGYVGPLTLATLGLV